jgi:hypothetical protein
MSSGKTLLLVISASLLLLYAWLLFDGWGETRDARKVEMVQVCLQTTVSRSVSLLNVPASQIHPANIVNATRSALPSGVQLDPHLHLLIPASHREAQFGITPQGELQLLSLQNFNRFHVNAGRIVRTNHWSNSF